MFLSVFNVLGVRKGGGGGSGGEKKSVRRREKELPTRGVKTLTSTLK